MSQDLYTALSGAYTSMRRLDTVAANLANVSTTGYKAQRLTIETTGGDGAYARIAEGLHDRSDGAVDRTGHPTDVALQGDGWLAVDGGDRVLLTRDGRIRPAPDGTLLAPGGQPVLGEAGPIVVPPGETVRIEADGTVQASLSGRLDTLRIVQGPAEPLGGNLWAPTGDLDEADPSTYELVPGALEGSNVDPMAAMVELVEASRTFEVFQKAMQASDESDARLNEMGRS